MFKISVSESSIVDCGKESIDKAFDKVNDAFFDGQKGIIMAQVCKSKCKKHLLIEGDFLDHETSKAAVEVMKGRKR